jgi:hypothetical protein
MPRRNNREDGVKRRGKGRKRHSGWHSGNGSDTDIAWRTTGSTLPQTATAADPAAASPAHIHTSSDRRGGRRGARGHGDSL